MAFASRWVIDGPGGTGLLLFVCSSVEEAGAGASVALGAGAPEGWSCSAWTVKDGWPSGGVLPSKGRYETPLMSDPPGGLAKLELGREGCRCRRSFCCWRARLVACVTGVLPGECSGW